MRPRSNGTGISYAIFESGQRERNLGMDATVYPAKGGGGRKRRSDSHYVRPETKRA